MLWKVHGVSWCNRFMLSLLSLPQYFCNLKALICTSPVVVKKMWCNKMRNGQKRQQCWENPIWSPCINCNHLNMVLNIFSVAMATFYMSTLNTDYSNPQIQTSRWHNNYSFEMSFSLYRTKRNIFTPLSSTKILPLHVTLPWMSCVTDCLKSVRVIESPQYICRQLSTPGTDSNVGTEKIRQHKETAVRG